MSERPKNRRAKNYGLSKQHTRKHARDFLDFDYVDKLTDEEKAFLDQFAREYYQSAFYLDPPLHPPQSPERRAIFVADNARRRDMWNEFKRIPGDVNYQIEKDEDEDK